MQRFKIGNWVEVYAQVQFIYEHNERKPSKDRFDPPIHGQIIGAGIRWLGTYKSSQPVGNIHRLDYDYEAPFLQQSNYMRIWKVLVGYNNKPLEVLDEDIKLYTNYTRTGWDLPWKNNNIRKPFIYKLASKKMLDNQAKV